MNEREKIQQVIVLQNAKRNNVMLLDQKKTIFLSIDIFSLLPFHLPYKTDRKLIDVIARNLQRFVLSLTVFPKLSLTEIEVLF